MRVERKVILLVAIVALLMAAGVNSWAQSQQTPDSLAYEWGVIILRNDTDESLVFGDGTGRMKDRNGRQYVNHGASAIFKLAALNPARAYTNLNIEFASGKSLRLGRIDIRPLMLYELRILKFNNAFSYDLGVSQQFKSNEELEKYLEWADTQTQSQPQQTTDSLAVEWGVLRICNDTNELVRFLDDSKEMRSLNGKQYVNPGEIAIFKLEALNSGRVYTNLNLEFESKSKLRLGHIYILSLGLYELTISKRGNAFSYDIRQFQHFKNTEEMEKYLESMGTHTR